MAGFDVISNHIGLILFSALFDSLLWFSPRLKLIRVLQPLIGEPIALPEMNSMEMLQALQATVDEFNLTSVLRTFPVGLPSLMAGRAPLGSPFGDSPAWDIPSLGIAFGLWLAFVLAGLASGTLYFIVVAQAAVRNEVNWRHAFSQWPWAYLQVLLLTLAWMMLVIMAVIPFSCFFSLVFLSGLGVGQFALVIAMLVAGFMVWLLIPLVFSPHGIFVNGYKVWVSVRESIRLTRLTLPTTSLLLLSILVISEGLDLLWGLPAETSWWTLVGIAGHAFVATSLLAASFVYYRDAHLWVQQILQQTRLSTA
ncbi:MAG: hypothetical protein JXA78_11670 [Anaerolineales bacterium]|nr:hypothetical protein [Anaerolineales bacterium]